MKLSRTLKQRSLEQFCLTPRRTMKEKSYIALADGKTQRNRSEKAQVLLIQIGRRIAFILSDSDVFSDLSEDRINELCETSRKAIAYKQTCCKSWRASRWDLRTSSPKEFLMKVSIGSVKEICSVFFSGMPIIERYVFNNAIIDPSSKDWVVSLMIANLIDIKSNSFQFLLRTSFSSSRESRSLMNSV